MDAQECKRSATPIVKVGLYTCKHVKGDVYGVPFVALDDRQAAQLFLSEFKSFASDDWSVFRIGDYYPKTGRVRPVSTRDNLLPVLSTSTKKGN